MKRLNTLAAALLLAAPLAAQTAPESQTQPVAPQPSQSAEPARETRGMPTANPQQESTAQPGRNKRLHQRRNKLRKLPPPGGIEHGTSRQHGFPQPGQKKPSNLVPN